MGLTFPYTYISCPCSDRSNKEDESSLRPAPLFHKRIPDQEPQEVEAEEAEEGPFDPRHPRSAYSLFPPEHLLYCEECRDIKCPRCIVEEQVSYFCTSCLFETPSSAVRSEGNR
jgi:dynactin 4